MFFLFEVLFDNLINGRVVDRKERRSEGGSGGCELRSEGFGEVSRERRSGRRDVDVKGMGERELMVGSERRDNVKVIRGNNGGE